MILRFAAATALLTLGACSHVAELIDDQSIEHDRIREDGHMLLSMTGDRRLIRTTKAGTQLHICAETQADAISGRRSQSGFELTGRGSLEDEIEHALTITYARTELSDVVRQLGWQLCNARLNDHIDGPTYQQALKGLQDQAMTVLLHRANVDNSALIREITEKYLRDKEARRTSEVKQQCLTKAGNDPVEKAKC